MTDDSLFLKLDNGVVIYSGGTNYGKIKEEKNTEKKTHIKFNILPTPDDKPVSFIATGPQHIVFICSGKMYVMGDNQYKQLGIVDFNK